MQSEMFSEMFVEFFDLDCILADIFAPVNHSYKTVSIL